MFGDELADDVYKLMIPENAMFYYIISSEGDKNISIYAVQSLDLVRFRRLFKKGKNTIIL